MDKNTIFSSELFATILKTLNWDIDGSYGQIKKMKSEPFQNWWHFFRITGLSISWRKGQKNQRFLRGKRLYKLIICDWNLDKRF